MIKACPHAEELKNLPDELPVTFNDIKSLWKLTNLFDVSEGFEEQDHMKLVSTYAVVKKRIELAFMKVIAS